MGDRVLGLNYAFQWVIVLDVRTFSGASGTAYFVIP
jgi:hypothetical protein